MVRKPATVQDTEPITWDLRRAFDSAFPLAADTSGDGGSGDSGSGNGGDSGDGTGSEGDDGSGDTGAGSTDDDKDVKDPDKKKLSDEAAAHRNKAKAEKERADAAEAKLREYEDKNKSELEKAQRDAEEYKKKNEKLQATVSDQAVKLAFFESGSAALFKNATTGLRLLKEELGELKPDDEGNVDSKAIKAKAEALLKEQPYLAADGESASGTGGDTGSPSGRANNGKKSKEQVDFEALAKKYPALRR